MTVSIVIKKAALTLEAKTLCVVCICVIWTTLNASIIIEKIVERACLASVYHIISNCVIRALFKTAIVKKNFPFDIT